MMLTEIFDACKNEPKQLKIHESILQSEKLIKDNYDMMQLYAPSLSIDVREKIRGIIDSYPASFNKTNLRLMMMQDGTGNILSMQNYLYCRTKFGNTMDLITGDGGFDFSIDFGSSGLVFAAGTNSGIFLSTIPIFTNSGRIS